ncbi:ABC transporter substrate-binding protein [Metallibacterium scheffleri]|uniref:ABC transporter substrate-binding protein n=2 Tax=Metallibacterium scheffleri TaxID=993689 RepID=A0A4S3KR62_9GAMM|nr:ABC transporter substrate-binding protein [Metallibacterium scheffleri]
MAAAGVHVFGPGGPAPAMKAAAAEFEKLHPGMRVQVTAGPTPQWLDAARATGDVIYSGSEAMMADFQRDLAGVLDAGTIEPLYLRPAVILVRPGNPDHITGFRSLLRPGMKVMVVNGAGQVGLWEDIAGRDGRIATLRAFRRNIVYAAPNSALALKRWQDDAAIQAWLSYNIWALAHPGLAQVVPLQRQYRLYRDCGVGLTIRGKANATARAFVRFLRSAQGRAIFELWGWQTAPGA